MKFKKSEASLILPNNAKAQSESAFSNNEEPEQKHSVSIDTANLEIGNSMFQGNTKLNNAMVR